MAEENDIKIEANLFNFDQDIYGQTLEIQFIKKIREEQKFDSIEALKDQLNRDKVETLGIPGL